MPSQAISLLVKSFNDIRANSSAIDLNFNGSTYQILKDLQSHFGKNGTDGSEIIMALGIPDQIAHQIPGINRDEIPKQSDNEAGGAKSPQSQILPLAPGPFMGTSISDSDSSDSYYLVYDWRGKKDCMYFKVNAQTEKVISSDWYHALD